MLWVFVLLELLVPRINVLFWLWLFSDLMLLIPVFIGILRLIEKHQTIRKVYGILKIVIGGFSFISFYRFYESIWQYAEQEPSTIQYQFIPTVFFSLTLITWAMSAGVVIVGRSSK